MAHRNRFQNRCCTRKAAMCGLAGFLLLGTVAAPYAHAEDMSPRQNHMSQRGPGGGGGGMRWIDELDLTAEQTESIQAIRDRYQPQIDALREQMQQHRNTMHNAMGSNASDAEIRQHRQQMMELRDEMSELRFNSMMDIRGVLTDEQRSQVRDWMEDHHGQRGNRRGNRGGNGPGNGPGNRRGNGPGNPGEGRGPGGMR